MSIKICSKKTRTLAHEIKRKIKSRVFLGFAFLILAILVELLFEIRDHVISVEKKINEKSAELADFIVAQTLVGDKEVAKLKINEMNSLGDNIQYLWVESRIADNPYHLTFLFPMSFEYAYPLPSIGKENFGYLSVTGYLVSKEDLIKDILIRIFLLIFIAFVMFLIFYPLANKIPLALIINPINEILTLLQDSDEENFNAKVNSSNKIKEILLIENKVLDLVRLSKEKSKVEAIGQLALQVAHDIRSPLAAITVLMGSDDVNSENNRVLIKSAINRIRDIADGLLTKYKKKEDSSQQKQITRVLLSTTVLSIISEKRVQYQNHAIEFIFLCETDSYFSCIDIDLVELKRILSNMMNNAVESMSEKSGVVKISLKKEGSHVLLSVMDSGLGMTSEKIDSIISSKKIESSKDDGHGFGLSHAKEILKKYHALLKIESVLNQGSTFTMSFALKEPPEWITSMISLQENDCVVILDDDRSIHDAVDKIFLTMAKKYPNISVIHFFDGLACIDYILKSSQDRQMFLLTDYELINQSVNGLDVIKNTKIERAILVTSYDEDARLVQRALALNKKVLPKPLLAYATINIV